MIGETFKDYGCHIEDISLCKQEKEILFAPYTCFKVESVHKCNDKKFKIHDEDKHIETQLKKELAILDDSQKERTYVVICEVVQGIEQKLHDDSDHRLPYASFFITLSMQDPEIRQQTCEEMVRFFFFFFFDVGVFCFDVYFSCFFFV